MHPNAMLLLPVFIQVGLTFALLFTLGPKRVAAVKRGDVKLKDIVLGQKAWPAGITQLSQSFDNQFQLPVLFYVLIGLALVTGKADIALTVAAWVFVVSRLAHAWVHVTSNRIGPRFNSYLVGALALLAAWIYFAVRILAPNLF
jgi:hypothetical protein